MRSMSFFGPPVSQGRLVKMMVEKLLNLPKGTSDIKGSAIANLGIIGDACTTRYLTEAWNKAKKIAARDYPDRFILDNRSTLQWKEEDVKILDKNISQANYKKLNELADNENLNVDEMVSLLIGNYKKGRK